jgi:hypothetical protein
MASEMDPRIKMTVIFNSGNFDGGATAAKTKIKTPVVFFLGGPKDMAQKNGDADYKALPSTIQSLKATVDVGHMGSYYQKSGGRMGKAASAFFKWQFKGDTASKALFCSPTTDSFLGKLGFQIESKNGMC